MARSDPDLLIRAAEAGDRRALARIMTAVETGDADGVAVVRRPYPRAGHAMVVGGTGAPGSGKTTLVDRLVEEARRAGLEVAVVLVDPSSPFSGGAILGDRIRMTRHASDDGVFVRSMAARRSLGGLAEGTARLVTALDGLGKDVIIVE